MKFTFIFEKHVSYSVSLQCDVLGVSRSGYYRWAQQEIPRRKRENAALIQRSRELYAQSRGRYGSPRITRSLQQEGYSCSRNRVARLMRQEGLRARPRRSYVVTTRSDHQLASPNILARQFKVSVPNRVWLSDITYIPTGEGWLYLSTVMDLCTRRIIGLSMRTDLSQEGVVQALRQAMKRANPPAGLIMHSDRGSQYASQEYRAVLRARGFRQSMSRKGNCWDNAPMESFFKTLKVELTHQMRYRTRSEAMNSIFEYIEIFYNRQRMHSALNYLTPEAFEAKIQNRLPL